MKERKPEVSVTWFQLDGRKAGGRYLTHTGFLRKRDARERLFVMEDGTRIPLDEVRDVEGTRFSIWKTDSTGFRLKLMSLT